MKAAIVDHFTLHKAFYNFSVVLLRKQLPGVIKHERVNGIQIDGLEWKVVLESAEFLHLEGDDVDEESHHW